MKRVLICSLLGVLCGVGCDRKPTVPPAIAEAAAAPASKPTEPPPTTQEVFAGPFKKVALPGMPISLSVPAKWNLEIAGAVTFLTGPTGAEDGRIQLAQRPEVTFKPEQIAMLIDGAHRDQQQAPDRYKKVEMHDIGSLKVLERLSFSRPITTPKVDGQGVAVMDEKGNFVTETTTPVAWRFSVFAPEDSVFHLYELNVIDLSAEQLPIVRPLLEKIFSSIAYEPNFVPAATPAPTAAPMMPGPSPTGMPPGPG